MVIDASGLLAILLDEPERRAFNEAIEAADARAMSVATLVELSIVLESRSGAEGLRDLDLFVVRAGIELVPVDLEQAHEARRAFSRFGRGRPPAGSTTEIALRTPSPACGANRSCSRVRISLRRTFSRFGRHCEGALTRRAA
jgi:ribonuclease VapC